MATRSSWSCRSSTSAPPVQPALRPPTCKRCTAPAEVAVNARSEVREVLLGLPHGLRPGKALPRRGGAASQAHLRGEPASLQRDAYRRLRAADGCARAGGGRHRLRPGAARLLGRRNQPQHRPDRPLAGREHRLPARLPAGAPRRPRTERQSTMSNRRNFFKTAGAVALGATAVSRVGAASLPEAVIQSSADDATAAGAVHRPSVQPRRHPQRLVAALAHEQRRQGIPPGGRARACASSRPG